MFEPDTTAHYVLLFGGAVLGPLFLAGSVIAIVTGLAKRSQVLVWTGITLLLVFGINVITHPLSSMLIWHQSVEARMSRMEKMCMRKAFSEEASMISFIVTAARTDKGSFNVEKEMF